jgi:uncharacterized RDD family membrane protein YckC
MNWYYVQAGNSVGPVSQTEFDLLVESGVIQPDTLVWQEGMAAWQPYSTLRAAAPAPVAVAAATTPAGLPSELPAAGSGEVVCAECNRMFPKDSVIQYGGVWVCANCKPAFVQKLREGAHLPMAGGLDYAGFWIRLGAKVLDWLILGVVFIVPSLIFFGIAISGGRVNPNETLGAQLLLQLGFYLVSFGYNTFFLGKFAATPGKMVCGLRVVMPGGTKIGYGRAMGRTLGEIVSGLVCNIGYIIAAFDSEKRALHDHIANTRVVRK